MERAKMLKPLDDVIEQMERDAPVSDNMLKAWEHINRLRRRAGLPPFSPLEPITVEERVNPAPPPAPRATA